MEEKKHSFEYYDLLQKIIDKEIGIFLISGRIWIWIHFFPDVDPHQNEVDPKH